MVDATPDAPGEPAKPVRAYVGLGSNLGDRVRNVLAAVAALGAREGILAVELSPFLESVPVGGPEGQGTYVNAAAALDTTLAPRELLETCMEIERALGRTRGIEEVRWGPRTIDIDILLYGDSIIRERGLSIPHPRMHERIFVLAPLAEIAPRARHPLAGKTVRELLLALGGERPAWFTPETRERAWRAAQEPEGN